MKVSKRNFVCALVAGLAFSGIGAAWAAALPGGGLYTPYYSNASHTTMVGAWGVSCATGNVIGWGQRTAYPGPTVHTSCGGGWPLPPDPYAPFD